MRGHLRNDVRKIRDRGNAILTSVGLAQARPEYRVLRTTIIVRLPVATLQIGMTGFQDGGYTAQL